MNNFLLTRQQIDGATKFLQDTKMIESGISAKNWEIYQVLPYLGDGNLLDMGSDGSVVLANAVKKGIKGQKVGIDLAYKDDVKSDIAGVDLIKGDLINVPFPDGFFNTITCLSVVEHEVSHEKLAEECSRLLQKGGRVFLSFDYWPTPLDTSKTKLYSLDWNIMDEGNLLALIEVFDFYGLKLTGEVDWTIQDAVINPKFCSPADVSYTFGILSFVKN